MGYIANRPSLYFITRLSSPLHLVPSLRSLVPRSLSLRFCFLSDAVILNHSHPLAVSATHFLICIRVLWNEIHHGKNKADGRDTAGSQSIRCPLVPVIISHSVTGPGCQPAPLFVNILCVCAVCCPSVFLATLAPTVPASVFITFIVMADEIRSVGCCSPPSVLLFSHLTCEVMGWSPVGQLFRHR